MTQKIKPEDIDLGDLESGCSELDKEECSNCDGYELLHDGTSCNLCTNGEVFEFQSPNIKKFIADKLNRIEKEIVKERFQTTKSHFIMLLEKEFCKK